MTVQNSLPDYNDLLVVYENYESNLEYMYGAGNLEYFAHEICEGRGEESEIDKVNINGQETYVIRSTNAVDAKSLFPPFLQYEYILQNDEGVYIYIIFRTYDASCDYCMDQIYTSLVIK